MATSGITFEICVDSVEGALAAQTGGAQRIELCANLLEGGTTPSSGTIALARHHLQIGLQVIIRPRGGDFCYSEIEFAVMRYEVEAAKHLGADGIVIGLLNPDGTVDKTRSAELIALARPLNVTFHRAFDMTCDPHQALEDLIDLGVDRVLTSGQESSALEGLDLITALVQQAKGRISVMPGGGINARNLSKIVAQSGVGELHMSVRSAVDSRMTYRNLRPKLGGALHPPEFTRLVTDADRVKTLIGVKVDREPGK